jgi:hypothetical protein
VPLTPADHPRLLNRRHPSTSRGAGSAHAAPDAGARAQRRYRWPIVEPTDDFCLLENPARPARFSLLQQVVAVDTIDAMIETVGAHPNGPVPVVGDAALAARRSGGDVTIRTYEPGHAVLDVSPTAPALLLVRESRLPGWEVHVDGVPVDPVPAAGLYFAIPLEPGRHEVVLRFRAPGFRAGLLVTLAWTIGAALWWSRTRDR